jgi:hypothetical protein
LQGEIPAFGLPNVVFSKKEKGLLSAKDEQTFWIGVIGI